MLLKEKSTHIFWYTLFVASLKTLPGKFSGTKPRSRKNSATRIILPWLKHHLISCDDVSNLRTLWLVYSFSRKNNTFPVWCHLSQPDTLSTCFMEDFYFCIATFVSLISKILLCLHMQTHSVLEIELYADQINIASAQPINFVLDSSE